ncbi:MAG: dinitrogenase iron-molybdenum cofactor biosynthesis protein [Desulfopila sp.]
MTEISTAPHNDCCCSQKSNKPAGVIHLPIAPQVVARTRFSPPSPIRNLGVMVPEAMDSLAQAMQKKPNIEPDMAPNITMVAITGPGDPLATPGITISAVEQIRARYPYLKIGLKTHGIGSDKLAGALAQAGVDYVEMQVNGVRAEILEKIYAWIRPGLKTLKISEAVKLLLKEQQNALPALTFQNIDVSILTTLYPGYNIDHVTKIAIEMMELGSRSMSLVPYTPEPGAEVDLASPDEKIIQEAAEKVRRHLLLVQPMLLQPEGHVGGETISEQPYQAKPSKQRPNVAVVSSNGIEIDLHLGQAISFLIYGPRADGLPCLLGTRDAPEPGTGKNRWQDVAVLLNDCFILLAASAGETPRRILGETGLKVHLAEDNIEGLIDVLYGGGKKCKK